MDELDQDISPNNPWEGSLRWWQSGTELIDWDTTCPSCGGSTERGEEFCESCEASGEGV